MVEYMNATRNGAAPIASSSYEVERSSDGTRPAASSLAACLACRQGGPSAYFLTAAMVRTFSPSKRLMISRRSGG
jgi:hypothetical protein